MFVDEAGSPVFRPQVSVGRGYVVAAVCVPAQERSNLIAILPRASGRLLKSSDAWMTPMAAATFVSKLLYSSVDVSLVLLDTAGVRAYKRAREATAASNALRRAIGNPRLNTHDLVYMLMLKDAVTAAWLKASQRLQAPVSFFDLVLDTASVAGHSRDLTVKAVQSTFHRAGLVCREVLWKRESDEPLLLVPDILAGVCRRQLTHHDVIDAWRLIEGAADAGRIALQDGMTSSV
jgi:hypothetical protein